MVTFDCHGNANGHLSWAVLCVNLLFTDTRMHTHARTPPHSSPHHLPLTHTTSTLPTLDGAIDIQQHLVGLTRSSPIEGSSERAVAK